MQIQKHKIGHTNIISIKDVIILAQKSRDNEEPLVMKNLGKTVIAEVAKMLSAIYLNNKYN